MRFNADDHVNRFSALVGQHRFRIEKVSNDTTRAGDPRIVLELKLLDSGRVHFERFMTEHSNPKVVEISMGKLSALSRAVGLPQWQDEQELTGLVGEAVWGPQKDSPEFSEIKKYIIPDEQKKAPASHPHRPVNVDRRGGQLAAAQAASTGRPTPPIDAYDDTDGVPF